MILRKLPINIPVVGRKWLTKDVHALIPRICEQVTLHGKDTLET